MAERSPPASVAALRIAPDVEIGRGVSSVVQLATSTDVDGPPRRYALKTIEKAKIFGQNQLTRLFREKELLGELRHPSIVRLHTTFQDESHLYFLLELLSGGELLWHMHRAQGRVPPATARTCMGALLLPLRFMLEQGVLYRDLKPTNVVFSAAGRLTLVDFGHAKRVAPGERSTSLCGTPHYHAPEAVRGEAHGLPAQLWALGVLLVEMTSGAAPYWEGRGGVSLKEQILGPPADLKDVPTEARPLAAALLRASPDEREAAFPRGYADVMDQPWLAELAWPAIEAGECVPASFDFEAAGRANGLLDGAAEDSTDAARGGPDEPDPFADF